MGDKKAKFASTYGHEELVNMVAELAAQSQTEAGVLIHALGPHPAKTPAQKFGDFFGAAHNTTKSPKEHQQPHPRRG